LRRSLLALSAALALAWGTAAQAHCDTLDGPVVSEARQALETGKLSTVLAWVQQKDEPEIRSAFERARTVRQGGERARELADTYFFETVVRLHRAGEGAPYTGLKPAGTPEPAVAAVDHSISEGNLDHVAKLILASVRDGLHAKFDAVMAGKKHSAEDVAAGRAFRSAYVDYVHYVEQLHDAARAGGDTHAGANTAHAH
jgi:hypothetical protein